MDSRTLVDLHDAFPAADMGGDRRSQRPLGRSVTMLSAAGGLVASAAGLMAYGVRGRSSSIFGPSVYRGRRDANNIAITFDDGPTPATLHLLDVLARYGVKATFFQCGIQVRRHPEIARAVHAAGHEIGNHSATHPLLSFRSPKFIFEELRSAQEAIGEAVNIAPVLFRAPYGVRWFGLREAQRKLNLLGVMWTILGRDWALPRGAIERRILGNARGGDIICLHDGRETQNAPDIRNTIEAVSGVVPVLLDRGIHFQTVSDLLCQTN
jgi:peptidoglycan-N-acetylglucosamine deacetylase